MSVRTELGQTSFFREAALFENLIGLQNRIPRDGRVASIPCADGREVWSIAQTLRCWAGRPDLSVDGYDINPEAIRNARNGRYYQELSPGSPLETILPALFPSNKLGLYAKIKVPEEFRASTRFQIHDIEKAPLPEAYHLICCYHLLHHINLGEDLTLDILKRIIGNLESSLTQGGILIVDQLSGVRSRIQSVSERLRRIPEARQSLPVPVGTSESHAVLFEKFAA